MLNFSADEVKDILDRTITQYEIERKFLLKKVPPIFLKKAKQIQILNLYSTLNGDHKSDTQARIRIQIEDEEQQIIKTNKTPVGLSYAQQESEVILTPAEFKQYIPYLTRFTKKIRYKLDVYGKMWEVDMFQNLHLILAELEALAKTSEEAERIEVSLRKYKLPKIINQFMITEVTDDRAFSNLALSEELDDSVHNLLRTFL